MDNPSKIPCDNLNTSCDFSDTTFKNPSSYASFAIRRRRNQRRLRHEITINMYILNRIRRLPMQNTNDLFTNQFFNGSTFP
ncbi:uncharacterized protein OCT59_009513 [Rhizophagus irregularis]|uniref:Uncharacterized protein n=1 Tax=Rhizophagus irregularis TaxID=588596 RepID=A0A916EAL0_9GLOM|nr:hypothetical protein OCT59_009513 [Rhizophagus irregularis]GBC25048.2 hypothetical protein GLOIN_2v1785898 [Rhizophagus irregularis DAOM 181602=DAOM 197198]CAB4383376.1 unnamed protein product [Rhizophagus irregularis]CAB5193523.1 unnamed protein product [Rhizophagus irregularis]CAB5367420.1 unnamed protein product [Rhizophagus irregularis]